MYRVKVRQIGNITWESVISSGTPNLKLIRDIGYQHAKGQLDKVLPVDGAMDGIFARAIFQACEYDQAFESTINYLDAVEYGFEEYKGGLRPTLNTLQGANPGSDIIMEEVDELLRDEQNVPSDTEDLDEVDINALSDNLSPCDNTAIAMPDIPVNATSENIFNITLGQVDDLIDLDFQMDDDNIFVENNQNQISQNEFTLEQWLANCEALL